jgi:hypothetical protein
MPARPIKKGEHFTVHHATFAGFCRLKSVAQDYYNLLLVILRCTFISN